MRAVFAADHNYESPYLTKHWVDVIGQTICINPGSGPKLHAVVLRLEGAKLLSAEHTVFGTITF